MHVSVPLRCTCHVPQGPKAQIVHTSMDSSTAPGAEIARVHYAPPEAHKNTDNNTNSQPITLDFQMWQRHCSRKSEAYAMQLL